MVIQPLMDDFQNSKHNQYSSSYGIILEQSLRYERIPDRVEQSMPSYSRQFLSIAQQKRLAACQQYCCAICKHLLPPQWQCDHKVALMNGGTNDISNFQILCPNCHANKTQIELINRGIQNRTYNKILKGPKRNRHHFNRIIKSPPTNHNIGSSHQLIRSHYFYPTPIPSVQMDSMTAQFLVKSKQIRNEKLRESRLLAIKTQKFMCEHCLNCYSNNTILQRHIVTQHHIDKDIPNEIQIKVE